MLDLNTWTWQPDIACPRNGRAAAATRRQRSLANRLERRRPVDLRADDQCLRAAPLWLIDAERVQARRSRRAIDYVPERIDVAPNGSAVFVLGGQSAGNSRQGAAVQGSAFVAIYDPKTLAERIRVPLSGLSLGFADQPTGSLTPGVAVAPDGSRYFVAHADRPVLDVVDTRAPRLERLERSVSLRDAPSQVATRQAWLGVSPDGSRLFTWRRAETPADDLGLQMVDVRTWRVQTLDAIADRLGTSLDGRWQFQLDPPASARPGARPPQQRGPRDPSGARLSVLDAATHAEVAVLPRDLMPSAMGQYGADRLYHARQFGRRPRAGDGGTAGATIALLTRIRGRRSRCALGGAWLARDDQPTLVGPLMPRAAVNGVELYYEDTATGFPLVFCHEFAGDYRSWDPQVRAFRPCVPLHHLQPARLSAVRACPTMPQAYSEGPAGRRPARPAAASRDRPGALSSGFRWAAAWC